MSATEPVCGPPKRLHPFRREQRILLIITMVGLVAGLTALYVRPHPTRQPTSTVTDAERRAARGRFLAFIQGGVTDFTVPAIAGGREVTEVWEKCFRRGDLASDSAPVLGTASWKEALGGGAVKYTWQVRMPYNPKIGDGGATRHLIVFVKGEPPRIADLRHLDYISMY